MATPFVTKTDIVTVHFDSVSAYVEETETKRAIAMSVFVTICAMKVAIAADHAGYQLKDSLKKFLDEMGVAYEDFGTSNAQSVDYPDFAKAVAEGVAGGRFDRGILVCGTGVGMAIAANKVPGVRSAPIVDTDTARLSREHNDLNVLTLGARLLPESRAREIVKTFLQTPFEGGRHLARVQKIHAIEATRAPAD